MKEKTNRISEQSKKWLVEALFDLMKEKPYSAISVKEISDKAQLSRRTFYRNFNIKEDLLSEYINYLIEEYMKNIEKLNDLTIENTIITYFEFCSKHIEDLKLLKKNHLFYTVMEQLSLYMLDINKFKTEWHNFSNSVEEDYICRFNIGGLWNVLSKWVDNDKRESPSKMAKIILKAIGNLSNSI